MIDLLYSRYGAGARDILNMPFAEGIEIIITAQRANDEEKLFMRWVFGYQLMISYEDFKSKLHANTNIQDDRTEEEILDSVKAILEM